MILPMKKYVILILLCLCSISACGKSKEKPVTKEASASNLEDVVDEKASSSELAKKVEERKQEEEELALSRYTNLGLVQCDSSFINFRSQPNENDIQNIIGILKNGAGVEILESPAAGTENWVKVRSGGLDGYISKQFLLEGEEAKEKAKEYIESYFNKYETIKAFMDHIVSDAEEKGYSTTMFNRRRYIPEIKSSNFVEKNRGKRAAMNAPLQGSAADIIKIAMVNVYNRLKEQGLKSRLILQVHDELIVEATGDELDQVEVLLREEMENAVNLKVDLKVDLNIGKSWYETK